jgi:hypothetical protein
VSAARDYLLGQFDTAWRLTDYHLETLTTDECLWRPASSGLHVHRQPDAIWSADWPDREGYDLGPPSIGWITWHMGFWWSMVFDHCFGPGTLTRERVDWPGSADAVRERLRGFEERWRGVLKGLTDEGLQATERTRWPFADRPFGDLVAWLTVELTKNASELGYARFLYAVRSR